MILGSVFGGGKGGCEGGGCLILHGAMEVL